jgi:2-polyprenyl-3-methyl-5-hydroxy-6-metoxy-1,4-benzoquinol methylase
MVYTNPRLADVNLAYEKRDVLNLDELRRYVMVKGPVFAKALERLSKFRKPPATLFDVGCGSGSFMVRAREFGYEVTGIEPSDVDVQYAVNTLGLNVTKGHFEEADISSLSFDIVTMWDVIEHVSDPRTMIRRAREMLRMGGVLALRIPCSTFHSVKAFFRGLFRGRQALVYGPVYHLSFFSPATIRRMLIEEGFGNVDIQLTTPEFHGGVLTRLVRKAWHTIALVSQAVAGAYLDNLEVYAVKIDTKPPGGK